MGYPQTTFSAHQHRTTSRIYSRISRTSRTYKQMPLAQGVRIFAVFILTLLLGACDSSLITSGNTDSTQVPNSPTRLSASAGDGLVTLTWVGSADADGYYVYFHTGANVSQHNYVGTPLRTSQTRVTISGLRNDVAWHFVVAAYKGNASSSLSATVTAIPQAALKPSIAAPQHVTAKSKRTTIRLRWARVANATSYNIYYATASFGNPPDISNYANVPGGTLIPNISGTKYRLTRLSKDTSYYLVVTAQNDYGVESAPSQQINVVLTTQTAQLFPLNDTGQTWSGNATLSESWEKMIAGYPPKLNIDCKTDTLAERAQDCNHGRDAANNDDSDGHAGLSFTKLNNQGKALPASANTWSCVRDNVTGLIWEAKTSSNNITGDDLHDSDDNFTWYNTNPKTNGGYVGVDMTTDTTSDTFIPGLHIIEKADSCYGYTKGDNATYCNTEAFIARVNASNNGAGLCGRADWRLPARGELRNLLRLDKRRSPPLDSRFFPHIPDVPNIAHMYRFGVRYQSYWTSSVAKASFNDSWDNVWGINLKRGSNSWYNPRRSLYVRLVSGTAMDGTNDVHPHIKNFWPNSRYQDHQDGTVTDVYTGLMWKRCSEGKNNDENCTGATAPFNWQQALELATRSNFAGYNDWRLPNIKELTSLIALDRSHPAINTEVFPNATDPDKYYSGYWTSTTYNPQKRIGTWSVEFHGGYDFADYYYQHNQLRLVRGGTEQSTTAEGGK